MNITTKDVSFLPSPHTSVKSQKAVPTPTAQREAGDGASGSWLHIGWSSRLYAERQENVGAEELWFNPSQQLRTTQLLTHCPGGVGKRIGRVKIRSIVGEIKTV